MARLKEYSGQKIILNLAVFLSVKYIIMVHGISLSLDDIFNNHMLPFDIFLMRYQRELEQNITKGFLPVLQTMDYHRKMMQQFKASDYLIRQILNSSLEMNDSRFNQSENHIIYPKNSAMPLLDDGSTKYAAWLKRTATLEDIQRQLHSTMKDSKRKNITVQRRIMNPSRKSTLVSYLNDDDSDDGDITGYANNFYLNNEPQEHSYSFKNIHSINDNKQISKTGYETAHDDYRSHHIPPESPISSSPIKQIKEISLKDIADIALTTLAFLSFGMFALQVLMCITMSKEENNNLMMLPMEVTDTPVTNDGTEEIRRKKRSVRQNQDILFAANKLAQKLMISIDQSHLQNRTKNGKPYFPDLCKFAEFGNETQMHGQKILAVLQSFGASWLAARVTDNYLSMLKRFAVIFQACV